MRSGSPSGSIACAVVLGLWLGLASAQDKPAYPSKLIRIVAPFPPGGPTDLYARIIGRHLQEAWSQPVVIENRPGGTGLLGTNLVRQAAADGYTLLFTSNSAHIISPLLHEPPSFDPVKDLTPITMVLRYPMYLLVHPGVPARTREDFGDRLRILRR